MDRFKDISPNSKIEKICIERKRHYSIIVEKAGSGDYNTEVPCETERLIEKLESKPYNYIIDKTTGVFLWKLENNQRSIWINIENCQWCSDDSEYEVKIAKDIRKVMMFYQELLSEIFNPENDDFINEISHARKELSIYNSNKVYTHTKDYSKDILLEQAQNYFQKEAGEKEYMKQYPSYVLKLLADINISKYYRYGLKIDFYHNDGGLKNAARWREFMALIKDGQEFAYPINKTEIVNIQLRVSGIDENDEVLCKASQTSINDMKLLIYALILNAAEQGRGKREIKENSIQTEPKNVIMVYVYKEDGCLVIENECEGTVDITKIMHKLRYIPDSEDDGISLWSFNCYIRSCINSLILARLKETERNLAKQQIDEWEIAELGIWINKLTSQEYEIQLEQPEKEDGKIYFRVMLPVFMEKYQSDEKGEEL